MTSIHTPSSGGLLGLEVAETRCVLPGGDCGLPSLGVGLQHPRSLCALGWEHGGWKMGSFLCHQKGDHAQVG